jgi:hypothetical protein
MSKFNFQRWLPIIIVLAAAFALIHLSRTDIENDAPQEEAEKLAMPSPTADYEPSEHLRNIFAYEAQYVPEVETSSTDVKSTKLKVKKNEAVYYSVNGIVWSTGNAMASINGNLLTEGMTYKTLKVLRILPDRVEVSVNGRNLVLVPKETHMAAVAPADSAAPKNAAKTAPPQPPHK